MNAGYQETSGNWRPRPCEHYSELKEHQNKEMFQCKVKQYNVFDSEYRTFKCENYLGKASLSDVN